MTEREQLIKELERTPNILVGEVLNFLLFLKEKTRRVITQNDALSIPEASPVLNFINQIETNLPVRDEEKLPSDFAKNLDHYLYGIPKKQNEENICRHRILDCSTEPQR